MLFTLHVADSTCSEPTDPSYKRNIWDKGDFVGFNDYIDRVDWLNLMSISLVPTDVWAAYIDIIREEVDIFLQLFIDNNNTNTKPKNLG